MKVKFIKTQIFNYTLGITGQVNLLPKLEFSSGIHYSSKDLHVTNFCHTCYHDYKVYEGFAEGKEKFRFIEVPLLIRYNIIDKNLAFMLKPE